MFRSLDMSFHQVVFAPESAWDVMNNLAHNEHVMLYHPPHVKFKATTPMTHYANSVIKRCEEAFEQLARIEAKIEEYRMPLRKFRLPPSDYVRQLDSVCVFKQTFGNRLFEETEREVSEKFTLLNGQLENLDHMVQKRLFAYERRMAYQVMDDLIAFDERPSDVSIRESFGPNNNREPSEDSSNNRLTRLEKRFNVILGIVPTENSLHLYKLIFRLAKENVMIRMRNLPEVVDRHVSGESRKHPKTLMFLLFQRGEANIIYDKIKHILTQFEFVELDIPSSSKRTEMMFEIYNELEENEKLLETTLAEIKSILRTFCHPSEIMELSYLYYVRLILKREQNFALNYRYLEQKDGFYQLQLFLPRAQIPILMNELNSIRTNDPHFTKPKVMEIHPRDNPKYPAVEPTLFALNSFVEPFQVLVSTYGIPRYKEINPAVFTVISFSFFFGLMFGDVGHGLILFLAGLFLYYSSNRDLQSFSTMLILMGFFAVYCGLIYNEFFSVPLPLGESCYDLESRAREPNCVYGFGADWIWGISRNETQFVNSFKMKFSIIIGVIQMLLGSFLKGLNAWYFSSKLDLFCEALPQFVLMSVTFGYMSFCIVVKWLTDWTGREGQSISIIQLFINLYTVEEPLYGSREFQQAIQITFIVIAVLCVFVMLLVKPITLSYWSPPHKKSIHSLLKEDDADPEHLLINQDHDTSGSGHDHPENFRDLMMHQMIETIEYVLGTVSNTASYLRLWALSLAHGQLSRVFMSMIFSNAIAEGDHWALLSLRVIFGFSFFVVVTVAIIMLMDTMECFLHALRLHWVEFQNKFFKGDGIDYLPFKHVY
jgi:V-type H+-transporting ATPase subunit a